MKVNARSQSQKDQDNTKYQRKAVRCVFRTTHSRTAVGHPVVLVSSTTKEQLPTLTRTDGPDPGKRFWTPSPSPVAGDTGRVGGNRSGLKKANENVFDASGYPRLFNLWRTSVNIRYAWHETNYDGEFRVGGGTVRILPGSERVRTWRCMRLSDGCKKGNKSEYRRMRRINRTG